MMNLEFQHGAFESAKAGLLAIGYQTSLFRNNYHFADIFLSTYPIRNIELAVFAQEPPSYREMHVLVLSTTMAAVLISPTG